MGEKLGRSHTACREKELGRGHAEVGLSASVVARGSSLLKLLPLGLVVGPCTWAKLGSFLNWAAGDRPVWASFWAYKEN